METKLSIFEQQEIRKLWDSQKWDWYFSIVDIIWALEVSNDSRNYWKVLKHRLLNERVIETVTNCNQLKMKVLDWKMRLTDVWDTKTILRLIQSVPSKKAEPFKMWLTKLWDERINEIHDPELGFEEVKGASQRWWNVAGVARKQLEIETKKKVVTSKNNFDERKRLK